MLCIFFTIFQSIINGYDSLVQMSSSLCAAWCHLFDALSEKSCLPLGISAINSSNFHFLNLSIFLIYCILVQPTKLKVVVARCDNVNFFFCRTSSPPPHRLYDGEPRHDHTHRPPHPQDHHAGQGELIMAYSSWHFRE